MEKKGQSFEKILASLGARQFVRNKTVEILSNHAGDGAEPQEVIDQLNREIVKDFVVIARDEISKIFAEIGEKLKVKD